MKHTVALIDWSHLIEDFLDNIGLSIDEFCQDMTGGWMFGYIEALKSVGVSTVLFCFSAQVAQPKRVQHRPTGATIWLVPSPALYRSLRKYIPNPYASTVLEAAGEFSWFKSAWLYLLLQLAPFLSTPLRSLAKLLKKEACTRILCQDYEHARFDLCVFLGSFLRIPVYASFQGGNWQQSKFEWLIRPFSLARCAGLIIASGVEHQRVVQQYGLKPAKIAQIFNPIDLSMWRGKNQAQAREQLQLAPHAKIAIWHGRIDLKRKGLDVLLEAWALVLGRVDQTTHPLQLYILGNGNDHVAFAALLKQHAMPSVSWLDSYINDRSLIATWLKAADLYVFPSRHEGFPVAPIEALASGLPLIASDAPGIPDILANGAESGGIIVPKNEAEALAKALQLVFEEDSLRISLGKNAQTRAENAFGLENVGLQLKNFMQLS